MYIKVEVSGIFIRFNSFGNNVVLDLTSQKENGSFNYKGLMSNDETRPAVIDCN